MFSVFGSQHGGHLLQVGEVALLLHADGETEGDDPLGDVDQVHLMVFFHGQNHTLAPRTTPTTSSGFLKFGIHYMMPNFPNPHFELTDCQNKGCDLDLITVCQSDREEASCAAMSECVVVSTTHNLIPEEENNFPCCLTMTCPLFFQHKLLTLHVFRYIFQPDAARVSREHPHRSNVNSQSSRLYFLERKTFTGFFQLLT